jgi:hypothetical protein
LPFHFFVQLMSSEQAPGFGLFNHCSGVLPLCCITAFSRPGIAGKALDFQLGAAYTGATDVVPDCEIRILFAGSRINGCGATHGKPHAVHKFRTSAHCSF